MNEHHTMLPGDYFLTLGYQKCGLRGKNGNNKHFPFDKTFLVKTISVIGLLIFSLNLKKNKEKY